MDDAREEIQGFFILLGVATVVGGGASALSFFISEYLPYYIGMLF